MRNVAAVMYENGYMPIPLTPNDKSIKIPEWQRRAAQRDFSLWDNRSSNSNLGAFCGEFEIIVDGDAHTTEHTNVTGRQIIDAFWESHKGEFEGSIRELTAGGGSHSSFRWTFGAVEFPSSGTVGKTFARFDYEGETVDIELLTRNAQAVSAPSTINGREYVFVSKETRANTKLGDLPELPRFIRDANRRFVLEKLAEQERRARDKAQMAWMVPQQDGKIGPDDIPVIIDSHVRSFLRNAVENHRHFNALGLAQTLSGLDCSSSDIRRAVEQYFRGCSRQPNKDEIDGIVKEAINKPDKKPAVPWRAIKEGRKKRGEKRTGTEVQRVTPATLFGYDQTSKGADKLGDEMKNIKGWNGE